MKGMNSSMYKVVLTLTITMLLLSAFIIPSLPKDSAEYVVTVLSMGVNGLLTLFVVIRIKMDLKKSRA